MILITDPKIAEKKIAEIDLLIRRSCVLPQQVFHNQFKKFRVIDFDEIFVDFFQRINACVEALRERIWTVAVVDPDPENYFYHHFRKYPIFDVTPKDSSEEYFSLISENFGDSPADSISSNGVIIIVYPKSGNWVVYADRNFEIGIVGFCNMETMGIFVSAYGNNRIFTIADALTNLLSVTFNGGVPKTLKAELLKYYG